MISRGVGEEGGISFAESASSSDEAERDSIRQSLSDTPSDPEIQDESVSERSASIVGDVTDETGARSSRMPHEVIEISEMEVQGVYTIGLRRKYSGLGMVS